jgi:hypothetical protein
MNRAIPNRLNLIEDANYQPSSSTVGTTGTGFDFKFSPPRSRAAAAILKISFA